jgi:hypothetical protein
MPTFLPFRAAGAVMGACLLAALAAPPAARAALQARDADGDAVTDAYFDTVLNLTWLRNANAAAGSAQDDGASSADGLMTWDSAQAWVAALSVAGQTGWRLPSIDTACNGSGTGFGCNAAAGELGTMFYVNLGGQVAQAISAANNGNLALFSGVGDVGYWSGNTAATDPDQAGVMLFGEGFQDFAFKAFNEQAAWAVHAGDVFAVPEPGSMGLMFGGLVALGGLCVRRTAGAARVSVR